MDNIYHIGKSFFCRYFSLFPIFLLIKQGNKGCRPRFWQKTNVYVFSFNGTIIFGARHNTLRVTNQFFYVWYSKIFDSQTTFSVLNSVYYFKNKPANTISNIHVGVLVNYVTAANLSWFSIGRFPQKYWFHFKNLVSVQFSCPVLVFNHFPLP